MASSSLSPHTAVPNKLHWAARIEDFKNDLFSKALSSIGWQPRIQPYTSFGSTSRVRVLGRALFAGPRSSADVHDKPVFDMRSLAKRGFRNFTSQPDAHLDLEIVLPTADGPKIFEARTDRSGILDVVLEAPMVPGVHEIIIRTNRRNEVTSTAHIYDDGVEGFGVVSDIDDTVMVTLLPRPLLAAWNAFVITQAARRIVPGMPVLYQQITRSVGADIPFVYLSTGAWNVFPVLQRFLFKNGYPAGPLLLTDWGPTQTGLFRSGQLHKHTSLELLHEWFPKTKWILIGDDGQHDPQTYGNFVAKHPDSVASVAIRQLTDDQQDLAHGAQRPLRSVGAAFRTLVGWIPRVWRSPKNESAEAAGHPASYRGTVLGAPVHSVPETVYSSGEGSPEDRAAPPAAAARTGIRWVAAPNGFGLIRALRRVGIMKSAD